MCDLNIAPLIGGIVISKRVWKKIPEKYHAEMKAVVKRVSERLHKETRTLDMKAMSTMKKHGLVVHKVSDDGRKAWENTVSKGYDAYVGKRFSRELFDRIKLLIEQFRKGSK